MQDFLARISQYSPKRLALLANALQQRVHELEAAGKAPIAIIGVGCRFPGGVSNPEQYWDLLSRAGDVISEVPPSRWDIEALYDADSNAPGKVSSRFGGFLREIDTFDPHFFGISPREAHRMDPQQRLLLEVTWEAIERAGIDADILAGTRTAVHVGVSGMDYFQLMQEGGLAAFDAYSASGTAHSIAAGRLSYVLGTRGPSFAIDTACSSSLVAVHEAVQSLRRRETDLALAGGVNLILRPEVSVALSKAGMLAPDGRCKAFDSRANGFVRGEGCGMLVLKRLDNAVADGNPIIAVIRGSAVNQDGRSNGLTAPNGIAQVEVLRDALADAGLAPADVGVVEAHGTGTSLGDPIEVQALAAVYGEQRDLGRPLLVGSVKANIGHLEAAAGIAGLVKLALVLHHGQLPAQQHFIEPNPHIPWDRLPVHIPREASVVPSGADGRRRGGVSSFGFSGTNAHLVLESWPGEATTETAGPLRPARPLHLLTASARDPRARAVIAAGLAGVLRQPGASLADVAHAANTGRAAQTHRLTVLAATAAEAASALDVVAALDVSADSEALPGGVHLASAPARTPRVAFLFTGQGAQYPGMARALYDGHPAFREAFDACCAVADPLLGHSLAALVLDPATPAATLDDTAITQPALFAVEYACASLWQRWGITPAAVLGHSVGEFAAACIAGVLTLEDAMRLVVTRGRLMSALPAGGGMLAIGAAESEVHRLIASHAPSVSIAAVNTPYRTVVAGTLADLERLRHASAAAGVEATPLQVSHAFHSPLIEPMLSRFEAEAALVKHHPARVEVVSNVTGRVLSPQELGASYWLRHARGTVRFADGLQTLASLGCDTFLEVGPHATLLAFARDVLPEDGRAFIPTMRRGADDWSSALGALGALWRRGVPVQWAAVDEGTSHRHVVLPTYPFQRERYWLDSITVRPSSPVTSSSTLLAREVRQAATPDTVRELVLDLAATPWLGGHRVLGEVRVPSPLWLGQLLEACDDTYGTVRDFRLLRGVVLQADVPVTVQLVITPPVDGAREVRVLTSTGDGPWAPVATARLVHESGSPPARVDLDALRARHDESVALPALYDWMATLDLDFGSAFRGLKALWRNPTGALARLEAPTDLHVPDGGRAHPALLDAAVHVAGALLQPFVAATPAPFFLVSIDRLCSWQPIPPRCWVQVEANDDLTLASTNSEARVTLRLLDDDGAVCLEAAGAVLRRPQSATTDPAAALLYDIQWEPLALSGPRLAEPSAIADAVADDIPRLAREHDLDGYVPVMSLLDAQCRDYIVHAIETLGAVWRPGMRLNAEEERKRLGVLPRHARLFGRLLEILAEDGVLMREENGFLVEVWPVAKGAASDTSHSDDPAIFLTARCGASLAPALRGTVDPLALLFPGGSLDDVSRLYQDTPAARVYNQLAARVVRALQKTAPAGRPLRILEIGAGTGSATRQILEALSDVRLEYTFTDVSPLFLRRAEEALGSRPGMRFLPFDLTADPAAQGLDAGSFDVVFGGNVVHATPDVERSVRMLRTLLAPNGTLVLLEATAPQRFADLTVGLLEGWWAFEDVHRRQYALLPRDQWQMVFRDAGFADSAIVVDASAGPILEGQAIFVAQASAGPVRRWLLVGGSAEHRATLADALVRRGHSVHTVETLAMATAFLAEGAAEWTDVVSLDATIVTLYEDATPEVLWGAQEHLIGGILTLVQALAARTPAPHLHVVTRGGQATATDESADPLQATVWGLSHAVVLEHPELCCRRVDLDPAISSSAAADTLAEELLGTDGEDQVVHRGGRRLVRRLAHHAPPPPSSTEPLPIRADRSYLVTGGMRGVGPRVADWLVAQGARAIVLMGRRVPDAACERWMGELRAKGVDVVATSGDVSVEVDVQRVLDTVRATMPPLAGIVHCAGLLDDGVLTRQTWDRFATVMAPKVVGSWHLHRLAGPLDFLVFYSSGASLAGSAGQANHAAANAFQDGLAWWRQARGLPTLSLNWGAWGEVGAAANIKLHWPALARPMQPTLALEAMARAGRRRCDTHLFPTAQVGVFDAEWKETAEGDGAGRLGSPFFSRLVARATPMPLTSVPAEVLRMAPTTPIEARTLRSRIDAASPNRRGALLAAEVRVLVARVLGIAPPESLDTSEPLRTLGLDSLMAVELRNVLAKSIGTPLPATITFDYPTADALTAFLRQGPLAGSFNSPTALVRTPTAPVEPMPAAGDPDVTEDELAARLARRLDALKSRRRN